MHNLKKSWNNVFGKKSLFWGFPKSINKFTKSTSMTELFFDIVLVAALGGAVHEFISIMGEYSVKNIFQINDFVFSIQQLLSLLLIWKAFTYYSSRYEKEGFRHRLITLVLMVGIIISSLSSWINPEELKETILYLDMIGLSLAFLVLFYFHITVWNNSDDKYEIMSLKYKWISYIVAAIINGISIVLLLSTTGTNAIFYSVIGLWSAEIIIVLVFEKLSSQIKIFVNIHRAINEHLKERYSILFIVFASEMLLRIIITSVDNITRDSESLGKIILNLMAGFIFIIALWWSFDFIINMTRIKNTSHIINYLYTNAIIGIFFGMVFITVGLEMIVDGPHTIGNNQQYQYGEVGKYVLLAGMVQYFAWLSVIGFYMKRYHKRHQIMWRFYIKWTLYLAPLLFIIISIPIKWIPSNIYMWVAIAYMYLFVAITLIGTYEFTTKGKKSVIEFNKKIANIKNKGRINIKKNIEPNIDVAWHKKHDFKINTFSKIAKKIDEKK